MKHRLPAGTKFRERNWTFWTETEGTVIGGIPQPVTPVQVGGTIPVRVVDKTESVQFRSTGKTVERAYKLIIESGVAPAIVEGMEADDAGTRFVVTQVNEYDSITVVRVTRFTQRRRAS